MFSLSIEFCFLSQPKPEPGIPPGPHWWSHVTPHAHSSPTSDYSISTLTLSNRQGAVALPRYRWMWFAISDIFYTQQTVNFTTASNPPPRIIIFKKNITLYILLSGSSGSSDRSPGRIGITLCGASDDFPKWPGKWSIQRYTGGIGNETLSSLRPNRIHWYPLDHFHFTIALKLLSTLLCLSSRIFIIK
jgi:hypothetical protein